MKNSECIIEQYRGDRLFRSFTPSEDQKYPWNMNVNGKIYPRTISPDGFEHMMEKEEIGLRPRTVYDADYQFFDKYME